MPKILVIEDEEVVRKAVGDFLSMNSHTVFIAKNGQAGLKIFQKKDIDIVLLDTKMPRMDWMKVLKHTKKHSPKTEAIVITGYDDMKTAINALKAGAFDYITTPINCEELNITIHRALEKSALLQQLIQSERLKTLGEMASGIAHNINNVLTIVLGHIRLLQSSPEDKQVLQDATNIISKSAWDGAQSIKTLQAFSGFSHHKGRSIPVDINYIIRESVEFTKPRWKDEAQFHNVRYNIRYNNLTSPVLIPGNPGELREVFVNIINNALDAMPEGGELSFSTEMNGSKVLISVADSGAGIPEELCDKVFEPFFTTKRNGGGVGLGLSTANTIITEHKGTISVKSAVGKGSKFTIKLPIIPKAGTEKRFVSALAHSARTATVLVIDDEKEICTIVAKILASAGHRVFTAQTGKDGIEIFKNNYIDLVLVDLTMPDISGWEVAKAIHALESKKRHKTPIAIFTGWGDTIEPSKLAKTGVNVVISKPLDNNHLLNIVRQTTQIRARKGGRRLLRGVKSKWAPINNGQELAFN